MDPNATWKRWQQLFISGPRDEEEEAAQDLLAWLERGGFEPAWTPREKGIFFTWVRRRRGPEERTALGCRDARDGQR